MEGEDIPRAVGETEGGQADLESDRGGLYEFPNPSRRKVSGFVFMGGALLAALGAVLGLPPGLYVVATVLAVIGLIHFLTSRRLTTTAEEALAAAGRAISFPIGHASAVVGFEGWRSRPVWQVMVYSADDPPTTRGLVRVDGLTGAVVGNPHEEEVVTA